ncbi:MAG: PKD domain-containing protein [Candidatus Nanohalobium sp.]
MKSTTISKSLLLVMFIGLSVSSVSALNSVDDVNIQLPESHPVDQPIEISGSAEGRSLDKIYLKEYNDLWETRKEKDCAGSSCSITWTGSVSETGVKTYRIKAEAGTEEGFATRNVNIVEPSEPDVEVDFSWSPQGPGVDEQVEFTAEVTSGDEGDVDSYVWDLKESGFYWGGETVHTSYGSEGSYTVVLKAKTDSGETLDTVKDEITVGEGDGPSNKPPVADFSFDPSNPVVGEQVVFDAGESYDPDGDSWDLSYEWDMDGDGDFETAGEEPVHSFDSSGSHEVSLRVTDDDGLSDTVSRTASVGNGEDEPEEGGVDVEVRDSDGDLLENAFVEVDGSEYRSGRTSGSGEISFSGLPTGSYDLKVECEGHQRSRNVYVTTGSDTVSVKLSNLHSSDDYCGDTGGEDPSAVLDVSPNPADLYESVTFDATSSSDDGSISKYRFDLDGDGDYDRTDWDGETSKTYYSSFSGYVKVKVYDEDGNTDTDRVYLQVQEEKQDGSLDVIVRDDGGDRLENALVEVDGSSRRTSGSGRAGFSGLEPGSYSIDVSCEGRSRQKSVYVGSGEDATDNVSLNFYSSDDYCGSEDGLDAEFSISDSNPEVGQSVNFDASSSTGDVVGYEWSFGDGGTSSGSQVVHSYDESGSYSVTLTVEGSSGSTDSVSKTVNVQEEVGEGPEAGFEYSPSSPSVGDQVSFDASSSTGDVVGYEWSFGDGGTSSGSQVVHTYSETGTYPVSLTVTGSQGEQDSAVKYVNVDLEPGACGITEDSFYFSLDDYVIEKGESTEAKLQIYNTGTRDQDVEAKFKVGTDTVVQRTVTVPSQGLKTVSEEVSPEEDSLVKAEFSTTGGPCGYKDFDSRVKELIVLEEGGGEASLDVNVDSDKGYVRNARVEVDGPEDRVRYTDSYGDAGFSLEPGSYDVDVSHPEYRSEEGSVNLKSGDNESLDFYLDRDERGEGTLRVKVEDEDGDGVEDARVRVDKGDTEVEYTDRDGYAVFSLEEGNYSIEVTHPDYNYTVHEEAEVEEGETTFRSVTLLQKKEGLEITDTGYRSSVCKGSTLSVDVTVKNNAEQTEYVTITGKGLGSINVIDPFLLDEGERKTRTVRFTNVEGSGAEEFRIQARNGTSDEAYRDVEVKDCQPVERPSDPTAVSMKLSYPVPPDRAVVGDTVKVTGFVDGVNRRTQVEIDVNGEQKAKVSTQPDGYYQTYITVDSIGTKTVRASSGGKSASREIEVVPTARVGMVDAPRKVFQGENFQVCSEVTSQVDPRVLLLRDGQILNSTNADGDVCFDVTASETGMHSFEVRALTYGEGSSSSTTVEVMETDVEARSYPDQIASVESGSGMVKVELYNTHREEKRYELQLEGLPSTWLSQSRKQVVLQPGERKTVYFYLTPREEGDYDPEIVVSADNQQVYRQKVDLETGGQKEPRRNSLINALVDLFGF